MQHNAGALLTLQNDDVTAKVYVINWSSLLLTMILVRVWNTRRCPVETSDITIINQWKREFIVLQAMGGFVWSSTPFLLLHRLDITRYEY